MHYLAIGIVVFAVALVLALAGCGRSATTNPTAEPPAVAALTQPAPAPLARADVVKRLQTLATSPPPKSLGGGGKCYMSPGPPDRFDYVCPTCGEKTLYAREAGGDRADNGVIWRLDRDLPECRRLAEAIRAIEVRLDETEFCQKCQPEAREPKLLLRVRSADDANETRTRDVSADDLRLIQEFLAGAAKHRSDDYAETPLKDHLPRLQELLGVKLDEGK